MRCHLIIRPNAFGENFGEISIIVFVPLFLSHIVMGDSCLIENEILQINFTRNKKKKSLKVFKSYFNVRMWKKI